MELIDSPCPDCDAEERVVLRQATSGWTLRCPECGRVATVPAPPKLRTVVVPVVLSWEATSRIVRLEVPLDDLVEIGGEAEVEGHRILITAIERPDASRPRKAPGRDIKTLYAKVFDTVPLGLTVNLGPTTRSYRWEVEPDHEVRIGEVVEVEGARIRITGLVALDRRRRHRGFLPARSIKRLLCEMADKPRLRRASGPGPPPASRKPPRRRSP